MLDFSSYLKDPQFSNKTNKKVIGKMKDEFEGNVGDEFVGLKSKMYSIKKLMVNNIIQQKKYILRLNLKNSKTLCLTGK